MSCPENSRSNSSGVPVTVKGVVNAQSPESASFSRCGITWTRIVWSLTRAYDKHYRPIPEYRQKFNKHGSHLELSGI